VLFPKDSDVTTPAVIEEVKGFRSCQMRAAEIEIGYVGSQSLIATEQGLTGSETLLGRGAQTGARLDNAPPSPLTFARALFNRSEYKSQAHTHNKPDLSHRPRSYELKSWTGRGFFISTSLRLSAIK
jgi:hypothetical protein